jgi:photosystem II stability/assembly factor-like uncharacterized protein
MKRLWALVLLFLASTFSVWAQSRDVEKVTVEALGLKGALITGIAVNDYNYIFVSASDGFSGDSGYVWVSKDSGKTWAQKKKGLEGIPFGSARAITAVDSGHILVGTIEDVFKSTDNGDGWHKVKASGNLGIEKNVRPSQFLRKGNTIFVVGFNSGFWRSDDNGWSWRQVSLVDSTFPYVQTITMTPSGTLFAGTGSADKGTGVFRSTDDGKTWAAVNNGLDNGKTGALSSLNIWRLAAPQAGISKTVIAVTEYAGVYQTDDEGDHWYKVENLPIFLGGAATICAHGIFVNGWNSVDKDATYRSVDSGVSWTKIPELNGYSVWSFAKFGERRLLVGTHDGMFLVTFDTPTSVESGYQPSALSFRLDQNYPNPFNPSTVISYELSVGGEVSLKVYNVLGQVVATLIDETQPAGSYSVRFDGSNLPSGVYFYRLQIYRGLISIITETKKMLLVR